MSLAQTNCAVVNDQQEVVFTGKYYACTTFISSHDDPDTVDLVRVKADGKLGRAMSFVFGPTMTGFVDYVLNFYGPKGLYPMGVTRHDATLATQHHLDTTVFCFDGCTWDREAVRDILIEMFGYKWPQHRSLSANQEV